ncbi:MAG: ABC transporter substrate-binding protein [Acidimicrobiales bacterium]
MSRLLALVTVMAFIVAACGGSSSDDSSDGGVKKTDTVDEGTPKPGGSMSIGLEAESTGWQPCVNSHSTSGVIVMTSIYDPLIARNADGDYTPYLAQSIKGNDTNTEWTLKLRSGVKFHDGTDLTAAVLKDNFDNNTKAETSTCLGAVKTITEVQVVDDLTVKYILDSPFGPFPSLLTGAVGYPFSPTNAKAKGEDVAANPVGTGPFKFGNWERDSKLTVTKNADYWRKGLPYLDEVVFRPIPDEDARLASVSSGEIDIIQTQRQEFVKQARDLGSAVKTYEHIGNNCGGSIFNTTVAPVDDKRVRNALANAMKQEDLIAILGGKGISPPCTQFFSKDSPWYSEKVAKAYPGFDVAKAKSLAEEYKNDPKRSDGKKPGDPLTVQFNCPGDPTLIAVAQGYQQMAQAAGIVMELKQVEQATHIGNAVGKPPFTSADYMINCWRLGGQGDPDSVLFNQYGSPEGNASNVTNFDNADVQAQLKIGRESADTDVRKAAYEKIGMIFSEEVPHVWTGATATSVVTKTNVRGIAGWKLPNDSTGIGPEESYVAAWALWRA